jgi:hypothetical protein
LTKRAVEKHVNSIFSKLDLTDTEDVSRRVKATLIFLDEQDDDDHLDHPRDSPSARRATHPSARVRSSSTSRTPRRAGYLGARG